MKFGFTADMAVKIQTEKDHEKREQLMMSIIDAILNDELMVKEMECDLLHIAMTKCSHSARFYAIEDKDLKLQVNAALREAGYKVSSNKEWLTVSF